MEIEDGGNAVVALKDCSGTAALGGGIGRLFKIAVAALGRGGSRRTCNDGVGISTVKAEGLYFDIGIGVGKDGERGSVRCKGHTLAAMATR